MSIIECISKVEGLVRPFTHQASPLAVSFVYSNSRKYFIQGLANDIPKNKISIPKSEKIKIWDLEFNCGLFNSAGMFKKGEAYSVCAAQGAGAYLAGTTTAVPRSGNKKLGVAHPFLAYPNSGSASNWMGLPNEGHDAVAARLAKIDKIPCCPVGASLGLAPEQTGSIALKSLVDGMNSYAAANVDFIEYNDSCPNVPHECANDGGLIDAALIDRLEYVSREFLKKRNRNLPVIVKFSVDQDLNALPQLLDMMIDLGFDGINLGNTSTDYDMARAKLHNSDLANFEYFVSNFGGGLSGSILKEKSLKAASIAQNHINRKILSKEFIVIRTGGIETSADIMQSIRAGIKLNQWFSGYFDNFAKYGHKVYKRMF